MSPLRTLSPLFLALCLPAMGWAQGSPTPIHSPLLQSRTAGWVPVQPMNPGPWLTGPSYQTVRATRHSGVAEGPLGFNLHGESFQPFASWDAEIILLANPTHNNELRLMGISNNYIHDDRPGYHYKFGAQPDPMNYTLGSISFIAKRASVGEMLIRMNDKGFSGYMPDEGQVQNLYAGTSVRVIVSDGGDDAGVGHSLMANGHLAAGGAFTCQVRERALHDLPLPAFAAKVSCWGDNSHGQLNAPASASFLMAGDNHVCAATTSILGGHNPWPITAATYQCWGGGREAPFAGAGSAWPGHTGSATGASGISCGVDAPPSSNLIQLGNMRCVNPDGVEVWNTSNTRFRSISLSRTHASACAVDGQTHQLTCWSNIATGANWPVAVPGPWDYVQIGTAHSCGLRLNGSIGCWGSDLGNAPAAGERFFQLAVGYTHSCAVRMDHSLKCWGSNTWGESTPPAGEYAQVTSGNGHSCAIRRDLARVCWGRNDKGQAPQLALGDLPVGPVNQPYVTHIDLFDASPSADPDFPYPLPNPAFVLAGGNLPPGLTLDADGIVHGTPTTTGAYAFSVKAEDAHGFVARRDYNVTIGPADTTPPTVQPQITGPLGNNGWYTGTVSLDWTVTEPESPLTLGITGCVPATLSTDTDGSGVNHACNASSAGGTSSPVIVTLKRDATPPTIEVTRGAPHSAAGWHNTDVPIRVDCADASPGSGVAVCPSVPTVTTEGLSFVPPQETTDHAGNTTSSLATLFVRLDKTAPTLAPVVTPNLLGIGDTASVTPHAADAVSGLAQVQCDAVDTTTPGHKTVTCTATDLADNTATAQATYRVCAPDISACPEIFDDGFED